MKIAVTSTGPTLEDTVDPRFGRCPYFLVVDTESLEFEAVENPNVTLGGGAGIQSASAMSEHGISAVLTGNCGPNAYQTLAAAGIDVIIGCSGRVADVVEQYKSGQATPAAEPNVAAHYGTGGSAPQQAPASDPARPQSPQPLAGDMGQADGMGMGAGMGRGMGGGMGRGMGRGGGRGMGGGMGRGGGRGMGRGGGMGMGRGMGGGFAAAGPASGPAGAPSADPQSELAALQQQAEMMRRQMEQINERIRQLQQDR